MKTTPWCLLALIISAPALSQQALVRSFDDTALEIGQAYLAHDTNRCLAILPTHVVTETRGVAAMLKEGTQPLLGESTTFADLGDDVSVAEITGAITEDCGFSTVAISRAVDRRIRANAVAAIRTVNGDGSIAQLSVTVIDDDGSTLLRVQPTHNQDQLRKGHSGSLLMAGDTPVGMLLRVDSRFGVGKVMRLDALLEKVDAFVAGATAAVATGTRETGAAEPIPSAAGAITSWSALPVDAQHRAHNLVASGDEPAWIANVERWPVELEMDLPGDRSAIAGIELDGRNVADPGQLPAGAEILLSVTQDGRRWRSVAGGNLEFADGIARFQIAPSWARQVKLVISGAQDGGSVIALGRLRIIPAP
jgi:hypothetical protein